jgi:3-hydroxymyristoyl/3-hydroxydecanoyl-(acyl carrier protein) dehydratase
MSLVAKADIESLIPQRKPIVMIDELLEQKEEYSRSSFTIESDNMFVDNGEFQAPGLIENIAQTAAARAGYHYMMQKTEPPIGFIGAVTKLKVHKTPTVGTQIETVVTQKSEVFNITLIEGKTYVGEDCIAECQMKIVINEQ